MHFTLSQSSNEDWGTVPDDLKDFTRRKFRDLDFHIGVAIIPSPAIKTANGPNYEQSGEVHHTTEVHGGESIDLSSPDVCFVLVIDPVFVKPVVDGGCEVNMVAEVAWAGRGGEELGFFGHLMGPIHFFIGPGVVFGDEAEAMGDACVTRSGTGGECLGG